MYFFSKFIPTSFLAIIFIVVIIILISNKGVFENILIGLLILGSTLFVMLSLILGSLLSYFKLYYAITNKRVLIQKGIIGTDFLIIDFDQITNAEVNVGLVDKVFNKNTGTIRISTPTSIVHTKHGSRVVPYTLSSITDPYTVFKYFKKVSHDVKTDIEFPNAYRPKTNEGYKTKYEG